MPTTCNSPRTDGALCNAPAGEAGFCFWHDSARREDMLQASSKGGSRTVLPFEITDPLAAAEMRGVLASVMAAVLSGALDPATGRAVAYIAQVERRVADGEGLEERLEVLESLISVRKRNQWQSAKSA